MVARRSVTFPQRTQRSLQHDPVGPWLVFELTKSSLVLVFVVVAALLSLTLGEDSGPSPRLRHKSLTIRRQVPSASVSVLDPLGRFRNSRSFCSHRA